MTPYTDLYDLFMMQVKDYNLNTLFQQSENNLNTYLQGFLILAIPDFNNCQQNLSDRNDTIGTFNFDLTDKEKNILSDLMIIRWLLKEIQDVTQMKNILNDTDFKMYSNANNLSSKQNYLSVLREMVSQEMSNYGLKYIDWNEWFTGVFYNDN